MQPDKKLEYINNLPPALPPPPPRPKKKDYGTWDECEPIISVEHLLWAADNRRMVWYERNDTPKSAAFYVNLSLRWLDILIKHGCFRLYKSKNIKGRRKNDGQI